MSNKTFTVLIENCRLKHEVDWDHGEDLATRLVPVAEIPKLVADEKIGHSLVVVALYHFDLWQRGIKKGVIAKLVHVPICYECQRYRTACCRWPGQSCV